MNSVIIFAAKYLILIPILVNLYIFWRLELGEKKKMLLLGLAGAILSYVLAKLGGHFYSNPRPPYKDGAHALVHYSEYNGFPSDHTLLAGWLAFLALAFSKKIGLALLAVAAIVGWGRVAAHVHHLLDIAGSFLITALVFVVLSQILKIGPANRLSSGRDENKHA